MRRKNSDTRPAKARTSKTTGRGTKGRTSRERARPASAPVFETLDQQVERLGLLDPLAAEPSTTFSPEDSES